MEDSGGAANSESHNAAHTAVMHLIVSVQAVRDLERFRQFLDDVDSSTAARVISSLLDAIEQIRSFPAIGRHVEHAPGTGEFRDLVTSEHVIRYMVGTEAVVILRVWHQREDR